MGFKGSVDLDFGKLVAAFAVCQNWNACHDFYNHAMGLIGVWIRNKLNDEQYILQLCQSHFQRNQRELLCSVRRGRGFAHCHVSATTATRHQTGRRAFLMNFIVLHTDKDEKWWTWFIRSAFFPIYEAVCVFRFLVCIYGIPVWISTVLLLRVSTHTYPWYTHTRAHLHCRVWIWSVVTVSVPRLLTGQSTRWAAMLNPYTSLLHFTVIQYIHLTTPHYTAPKNALPFNVEASSTVSSLLSLRGKCPPHYIYTELVCSPHL